MVTAQLQAGTGYTVGISSSASVTVEDNDDPSRSHLIPSAPTSFQAQCLDDNCNIIEFLWDPPTQGLPISYYELYDFVTETRGDWLGASVVAPKQGITVHYKDDEKISGPFTFRVRAVNEHGTGPEASITMTIPP